METEKELLACHHTAGILGSAAKDTNLSVEPFVLMTK